MCVRETHIYIYRVNNEYIESEYQTKQYAMFLLINAQTIPKIKQKDLPMYLSVTLYIYMYIYIMSFILLK